MPATAIGPGNLGCARTVFFSSRRRHTRFDCDWSSDVCSSDLLATAARIGRPNDVALARVTAEALRLSGRPDAGVALIEDLFKRSTADSAAHIALAQVYSNNDRGAEAVKVLQEAAVRFPSETAITFELGATFEKQRRYTDAEAAFRQVISVDP